MPMATPNSVNAFGWMLRKKLKKKKKKILSHQLQNIIFRYFNLPHIHGAFSKKKKGNLGQLSQNCPCPVLPLVYDTSSLHLRQTNAHVLLALLLFTLGMQFGFVFSSVHSFLKGHSTFNNCSCVCQYYGNMKLFFF